jgi:hypothetical protein
VFGSFFYGLNEWLIFAALLGFLFLTTEIGFQIGGRVRTGINEYTRSQTLLLGDNFFTKENKGSSYPKYNFSPGENSYFILLSGRTFLISLKQGRQKCRNEGSNHFQAHLTCYSGTQFAGSNTAWEEYMENTSREGTRT